jgi:hypothetical protein
VIGKIGKCEYGVVRFKNNHPEFGNFIALDWTETRNHNVFSSSVSLKFIL